MKWTFALSLSLTVSAAIAAQQPAPEFEVASIKLSTAGDSNAMLAPSKGRFSATNVTLMQLVRFAFQIQEFQVSGQPSWFTTERYDIEAKAPPDVSAEQAEVWQRMLQRLLADRFRLTYRIEQRDQSVFELVVSRGGHKLTQVQPSNCATSVPGECGFLASAGRIRGSQVSMDALATRLSRSIARTVVNKTGVDGVFNLLLEWMPDSQLALRPDQPGPDPGGPSIFTALQEQLGLRLESANGSIPVYVIDRVERPSEN
jgi:uncharacterized protein (TIGR03435 family)